MEDFYDKEMKHRKKSQKRTPKKHNHKHDFQDCIFEWDNPQGKLTEKGFILKHEMLGGTYCTICRKVGSIESEWWSTSKKMSFDWYNRICEGKIIRYEISERAKKEINPKTRTLPTFYLVDGWGTKYI